MPKNKITTQGYFVRRLRNSGYITSRVYDRYQDQDPRKWTIVIDPDGDSVLITCWDTGEWPYRGMYELSDGGRKIPKGYHINTDSIEVIVNHLSQFNIVTAVNNYNGRTKPKQSREKAREEASEKNG